MKILKNSPKKSDDSFDDDEFYDLWVPACKEYIHVDQLYGKHQRAHQAAKKAMEKLTAVKAAAKATRAKASERVRKAAATSRLLQKRAKTAELKAKKALEKL